MARGGVRPGSGRPIGAVAQIDREAREAALASGISPLDFLLAAMRDDQHEFSTRLDAAKAAAPYVHAKLASVVVQGDEDNPLKTITRVEYVIVRPPNRNT
jgi:methanogenic corrinoid protein MtbC1